MMLSLKTEKSWKKKCPQSHFQGLRTFFLSGLDQNPLEGVIPVYMTAEGF